MAKRQLTRRQAWRIQKIQDERVSRAARRQQPLEADDDRLGPEQTGRVVANYGASLDVEDAERAVHRCHLRQNLTMPVVGDRVAWRGADDDKGVVVAVMPRDSVLARPDATGEMKAIAANIDRICVVSAPLPVYSTDGLDQFLVAAEASDIPPLLVFNKTDLLDEAERQRVERDLARYRHIGYRILHASTVANHGLDELTESLCEGTSIFIGQSGVGKSSLVRSLVGDQAIVVGDLAELTGLGRHTTSAARLYHLPSGGDVIDAPGVREFRLWPMPRQELAEGFVEFRPFLGHCRFRDCRHEGEPACAVEAAVAEGRIHPERLASFRRMAREVASSGVKAGG